MEESTSHENPELHQPLPAGSSADPQSGIAALSEDLALAQLKDSNATPELIEQISRNAAAMKSRKVRMAVAGSRSGSPTVGVACGPRTVHI